MGEQKTAKREKQEQLRSALGFLSQPAWIASNNRTVEFYNQAWKNFVGKSKKQTPPHVGDSIEPSLVEEFEAIWRVAERNKSAFDMEVQLKHADGHYQWFALGVSPILGDDGVIGGWVGINTLIHELKERSESFVQRLAHAEREARKQAELFREMADNIEEIFWVTDARGATPIFISRAFEKIYGRSIRSLTANPKIFFDATHPDDRAKLADHIRLQREERIPWELEFRILRPSGEVRWLWARSFSVFDDSGNLLRLCGITSDITDRKLTEQRVSEFYSTVSHELRTPLTSIRGALGLLDGGKGGDLSTLGQQLVAVGREECDRLVRLVNDFLDMRKIEANRLELHMQKLEPEKVVRGVVDAVAPFAADRQVKLKFHCACNERVAADRDKMVQVLTNLVSNAIKFSPADAQVEISTTREGSFVRFSVKDYGPGISPANQAKLFQLFQQISSDQGTPEGTGLGLAICKALTERMGGKIGVQSAEGSGAVFSCDIPIALKDTQEVGVAPAGEHARVLIIEDDDSTRAILKQQILALGVATLEVRSGEAGILEARASKPDLIILDLGLPGIDGFDVVRALSQDADLRNTPLIVYTARDLSDEDKERLKLGQSVHLTKSKIGEQAFLQHVANFLDGLIKPKE